jgi:hypothetical protein
LLKKKWFVGYKERGSKMTKKKLLAKAKGMGLDVTDKMTKAQIQAAINDAESVEVEVEVEVEETTIELDADFIADDDVVIQFTPAEAEEVLEETAEEETDMIDDSGDDPIIENLPPESFIESEEDVKLSPVQEENARRVKAIADAQVELVALSKLTEAQLREYSELKGHVFSPELDKQQIFTSLRNGIIGKLKKPKK